VSRLKYFVLAVLLLLVLGAGGGWAFLASSLPRTSGTLVLAELTAPVSVVRDSADVPTIRAQNTQDLYVALGFVHAQERLFQMDQQRRVVQGRLSEVFGAKALTTDRALRTLGLYRHAAASVPLISPEFMDVLSAYAAGVNAFLDSGKRLPIEFTLLGYRPDRWRPADSLAMGKLLALQLSGNYRRELLRARLAQRLDAEQINQLFPQYPKEAPVTLAKLAELTRDQPLDRMLDELPELIGPKQASNNWVVDGAHSVTGKPLLANDPHLDYSAPIIWYLTRLEAPDLTLTGATMAGAPLVILGHNGQIAWGYTTTNADVEDVFVEKLDPADPTRYLTPEGSRPFELINELIPVKGHAPEALVTRITRHGPVISDLGGTDQVPADRVMALQATFLTDDDRSVEAQWRATLARNWREWVEALRPFTAPMQNMVYADRNGNIGFYAPGRIPIRKAGDGRGPAPGWTGEYDWDGWVPFDKLPQAFNPPAGHIATANNKIVPDDYPYLITNDWDLPYRIERIEAALSGPGKQSIQSSTEIQADIVSLAAKQLLPLMLRIEPSDARARMALEMLAKWDCQMAAGRPEPLIFIAWLRSLNRRLFEPKLGPMFDQYWSLTPLATQGALTVNQHWCGPAGCPAPLRASLNDALGELSTKYGDDPKTWRWGDAHYALFAHPVFHTLPIVRALFDRQWPAEGSTDTVNAGAFRFTNPDGAYVDLHGPALRAIYDLADLDRSVFLIALGQSAHLLSPHRDDLVTRWRSFNWLRLPHDAQGQTLLLTPKS
jgi:penicillin G amidase